MLKQRIEYYLQDIKKYLTRYLKETYNSIKGVFQKSKKPNETKKWQFMTLFTLTALIIIFTNKTVALLAMITAITVFHYYEYKKGIHREQQRTITQHLRTREPLQPKAASAEGEKTTPQPEQKEEPSRQDITGQPHSQASIKK